MRVVYHFSEIVYRISEIEYLNGKQFNAFLYIKLLSLVFAKKTTKSKQKNKKLEFKNNPICFPQL